MAEKSNHQAADNSGLHEQLINIRRVAKVVKGVVFLGFSALTLLVMAKVELASVVLRRVKCLLQCKKRWRTHGGE
ncbi:MAG: hypothetical protein CM1200mP41_22440 [Gammaproteobacteria bacterium]|nr:MAG: hypothetical protein CM1200mP41_22440 [Gammaproteobacteria bacterium]